MGVRELLTKEELKNVEFMLKYAAKHPPSNDWELNFLVSIEEWVKEDGKLSKEQYKKLQEVFSKLE
jgi:hypothetical protein